MKHRIRQLVATMLVALLLALPGIAGAADAPQAADPAGSGQNGAQRLSPEQLEQILAPVALYPDSLLAQVLMAATYPLEVVSAARWAQANPKVKGKELDAALQQQPWDASVKSLVAFPQVLQMMNEKLDWTQKLGDAFLAQQQDTMDAVQRLRAKAQAQGTLTSSKEQTVKVEKSSGSSTQVIVIQPTQPDVVYVPAYNPTVVYGVWAYPSYPPYAWYPPGYAASNVLSFGLGVAAGYAMWGNVDWHHGGDINIDVNNYRNFTHVSPPANWNINGGRWQHDPEHRKGVPYHDQNVARQFQGVNHDAVRNQERASAREAFRGHTGGDGPDGHMQRPGADGHGQRMDGGRRPGSDGHGQRMDGGQRPGSGGHGEQFQPGSRDNVNRRTAPQVNRGAVQHNRSAFQDMGRGQAAHFDGQRGAGSRQVMQSHPGGGGGRTLPQGGGGGGGHFRR